MTHPSKAKGSAYERLIADYLKLCGFPCERIPAGASDDRGDLWLPGHTLQLKNRARLDLAGWWAETQAQRDTNGHRFGWLVHKRHGVTDPSRQWVTCDVATLAEVLTEVGR